MPIPDLELTVRLVGLPLDELWSRYLAVGGSATRRVFIERVAGNVSWSPHEELFLAVALNDALLDESLALLNPLDGLLADRRPGSRSNGDGRPVEQAENPTEETSAIVSSTVELGGLIARAQDARASARRIRSSAQEVRRRVAASTNGPSLLDGQVLH